MFLAQSPRFVCYMLTLLGDQQDHACEGLLVINNRLDCIVFFVGVEIG